MEDEPERIDAYIAGLAPAEAKAVRSFRRLVLAIAPDAKQGISYGMPAFQVGAAKVGVMAFAKHLTFFPFSGTFLDAWRGELQGFGGTKGGVHFTPKKPIPAALLRRMVKARLTPRRRPPAARRRPS